MINGIYIGQSVISAITDNEIVIAKIGKLFISGYIIGSTCIFPRDYRQNYYGFVILSFSNIKKIF
jgi:hypothetical protein